MVLSLPKMQLPAWLRMPSLPIGGISLLEPKIPEVAFDIDRDSVAMIRMGRRKKERFLAAWEVLELPPGLMETDFYSVRLTEPQKFEEIVRGAVSREEVKIEKASLLLPDNYARVAILTLDQLPRRRADALKAVKWKIRKAVPFKVDDASIDYMVLPGPGPQVDILAVLIPRSVVEGFERIFDGLGIHTGLVDLSTLSLLNLYRPVLQREIVNGSEFMVANISAGFVTFVIFRGRRMIFFRSKPFAPAVEGDNGEGALRLIRRELQTSLLYYREKLEGKELAKAYLRVVDVNLEAVASVFDEQREVAEVDSISPVRVLDVDDRLAGEQGARTLQRLAPALGATLGREVA